MKQKHFFLIILLFLLVISVFYSSCLKDRAPTPLVKKVCSCADTIKYSTDIVPIINSNCLNGCHVSHGSAPDNFTTYAGFAADADAPVGNGTIRSYVLNGNPEWMPKGLAPLPDSLQCKINCWLNQGALNN